MGTVVVEGRARPEVGNGTARRTERRPSLALALVGVERKGKRIVPAAGRGLERTRVRVRVRAQGVSRATAVAEAAAAARGRRRGLMKAMMTAKNRTWNSLIHCHQIFMTKASWPILRRYVCMTRCAGKAVVRKT